MDVDCRDRFLCGFLEGMRAARPKEKIEDRPGREFLKADRKSLE
jgi:hypothetical protein